MNKHRIFVRTGKTLIAAVALVAMTATAALAQTDPYAGAGNLGRNQVGYALNAIIVVVLALGGVAMITGWIGQWKQPDFRDKFANVVQVGAITVMVCVFALGFFDAGPGLLSAIQGAVGGTNP